MLESSSITVVKLPHIVKTLSLRLNNYLFLLVFLLHQKAHVAGQEPNVLKEHTQCLLSRITMRSIV